MSEHDDLLPGLRDELVRSAWRQRARHRRRRVLVSIGAAAVAASIAIVAVLAVGSSDPVAAGVEVEVVDGRIVVELTDVETRPGVVEAALRDVGLDAVVTALPVGPSNVGRFVAAESNLPGGVDADIDQQSFVVFSAPVGLRDRIELGLGRPAEGETYAAASDAYAPGEPLSCSGLYGQPVQHLRAFADDHPELEISVQPFLDGPGIAVAADDPALDGLRVVDAVSTAPDTVLVYATEDGSSPFANPLSPERGACRE